MTIHDFRFNFLRDQWECWCGKSITAKRVARGRRWHFLAGHR